MDESLLRITSCFLFLKIIVVRTSILKVKTFKVYYTLPLQPIMCFAYCPFKFKIKQCTPHPLYLHAMCIFWETMLFFWTERQVLSRWPRVKRSIFLKTLTSQSFSSFFFFFFFFSLYSFSLLSLSTMVDVDKHLGISFSPVRRYPSRKSFGFAKIFLRKFAKWCDVGLPWR